MIRLIALLLSLLALSGCVDPCVLSGLADGGQR